MEDKIIEKIKNCGFDDIRLLSEGGHGQVFFVRRNGAAYVLKSYFANSKAEANHEKEIAQKLHGHGKGNPYGFKSEVIAASDGTFFLLNHTDEGKTIEEIKENSKEKLSIHEATEIMIKSCEAIRALHNQGIIHFDVKPTNLYLISEVSYLKSIDYGSAVEIKKVSKEPQKENYEEIYNKIISSSGYYSTEGYMTKRLQEFCEKRELFSRINTTKEQQISLVEDEKKLGPKEDIYAMICTYAFLLGFRNWGVWSQDFCYLSTEQKIRLTLEENDIPAYLISPLVDLFMTIDEPSKNPNAEVPFESVTQLIETLKIISRVIKLEGFHPAICQYNATKKYDEEWSKLLKKFDPDLVCKIEGTDLCLSEIILDKSHTQSLYLISEGGSGKTVQMLYAYKNLLDVFAETKIVPLFVPMNRFNNSDFFIRDYIIENYVGYIDRDCAESNRKKLKEMFEDDSYSFCLFLDGINETSVSTGKAYHEIAELSKLKNVRIVLSSRTDFDNLPEFTRIKLKKLENDIIEQTINGRKINKELRKLLGIPFYLTRFLEIPDNRTTQMTSSTELLCEYFNWIKEKANESLDSIDYMDFCDVLINKFLPEFAYEQVFFNSTPLVFEKETCTEVWKKTKDKHDLHFAKSCIDTLKELGVIRKIDSDFFAFDHQNTLSFFVAKYVFDLIRRNQQKGDDVLIDVSDTLTLKSIGEFFGEHHYANKESLDKENSPIEKKLDKYRGIFDDLTTARIISKYVDIMKLCRGKSICAQLDNLDLSHMDLNHFDWSGSSFSNSIFSANSFNGILMKSPINLVYYNEDKNRLIASDLNRDIILMDSSCNIIHKFYHFSESANFIGIGDDFVVYGYYDGKSIYFDNSNLSYFGLDTGTMLLFDDNEPLLMSVVCKHLKLKVFFVEDALGEKLLFVEEKSETIREIEKTIFVDGVTKYTPTFSPRNLSCFFEYEINNIIGPCRGGITMELDDEPTSKYALLSANSIYNAKSFISSDKRISNDDVSMELLIRSTKGSWTFDISKGKCTHINKSQHFRWIDSILISEKHNLFIDRNNSCFYGHRVNNDISVRNNHEITVLNITDVPIIPSQNCRCNEHTFMSYNNNDIYMCNIFENEFVPFWIRKKGNILRGGCIWKNEVFYAICEEEGNLYLSITDMNKGMELIDMGIRLNSSEIETLSNYDESQNMRFSKIAYDQDKIIIGVSGSRIIVYDIINNSYFAISNDIFAISFYDILNNMTDFSVQDNELFILIDSYELDVYKLQMKFKNNLCTESANMNLQIHQKLGQKEIVPLSYENGVVPMVIENFADVLKDDEIYCSLSIKRIIRVLSDITIRNCNFNGAVIKAEEREQSIPEEILFNT